MLRSLVWEEGGGLEQDLKAKRGPLSLHFCVEKAPLRDTYSDSPLGRRNSNAGVNPILARIESPSG